MEFIGPVTNAAAVCEAILRGLPEWFGIEDALVAYVADTARYPTFLVKATETDVARAIGFLTARQHFARTWEVHCIAVDRTHHRQGVGRVMLEGLLHWLKPQGAQYLQVKTLADTSPSLEYAQTRRFYTAMGFEPLEVFEDLWGPTNPCLQMIKALHAHG